MRINKFFLLLLIPFTCWGQNDFRPGFIINNQGDSIKGYVNYKRNKVNSSRCEFRLHLESKSQIYLPSDIKYYQFDNGKFYISKNLNKDSNKKYFVTHLFSGLVNLYSYQDDLGEHFFIEDELKHVYELSNNDREYIVNGNLHIQPAREYIGVLKYVFRDSHRIVKKVEMVSLNAKSLVSIATDYHNEESNGQYEAFERNQSNAEKSFGAMIGLSSSRLIKKNDLSDDLVYLNTSDFGSQQAPFVGIFINATMPNLNERITFQYEASISYMKLSTTNTYIEPIYEMQNRHQINLEQFGLNHEFMIRYIMSNTNISPVIRLGMFYEHFFNSKYNRDVQINFSWGGLYEEYQSNKNPFDQNDYGLSLGFGIDNELRNGKHYQLNLIYQYGFGFLENFNSESIQLNFALQLSK